MAASAPLWQCSLYTYRMSVWGSQAPHNAAVSVTNVHPKDARPVRGNRDGVDRNLGLLNGVNPAADTVQSIQSLRQGVHLIIVCRIGKRGAFLNQNLHPRRYRRMREVHVAGLDLRTYPGRPSDLAALRVHRD